MFLFFCPIPLPFFVNNLTSIAHAPMIATDAMCVPFSFCERWLIYIAYGIFPPALI
jgi:hypothetical protein